MIVPMDRINPDTLRKMVEEFVTREWSELADTDYRLRMSGLVDMMREYWVFEREYWAKKLSR